MKFTTLRLSGFKSFVDPTELALMPGLTGVVGPNGCGKSNLLEALRWVMGESRAKSMRGDGMEDVIFAGADTRPARNFAEVSLMLEGAQGSAPAPFNAEDTLEIARRITRNAGSAFRINGKEMRARDIRVLFADAATGPQSPSLVRQGQIGLLIAAKPQGRRKVLEDAAGIAGLYERRKEVEQRLRAAEENLLRVDDVLARLDTQVSGLKRQARQAERYATLTETIKSAGAELLWLRYRTAAAEAAEAQTAMDAAQRTVAAATTEDSQTVRAREEAESALPPLREEAAVATAVQQRLTARREAIEADRRRAVETLTRLERDLARFTDDLGREADLSGDAQTAIEALEAERAEIRAIASDADATSKAAAAIVEAEATLTRAEAERDALAATAAAGMAERKAAERMHCDADRALEDARNKLATTVARMETEQATLNEVAATLDSARAEADATSRAIAGAPARLAEAEADRSALDGEESTAMATLAARQRDLAALSDEAVRLDKALAAPGDAAGILHSVRAAPGYERALAAALGDAAGAPIDAYAPDKRGWSVLDPLGTPPQGEPLARFVTAPAALGRILATTAIIPQEIGATAQATLKQGQRLVSREGDLWRWDGFFRGGEMAGDDSGALRLERLNRRESLDRDQDEATRQVAQAKADHDALVDRQKRAHQTENDLRQALKQGEDAAAKAARHLADLDADHARRDTSVARLSEDVETLRAALAIATERAAEAAENLTRIADPQGLHTKAEAAQTALAQSRTALDNARSLHAGLTDAEARRTERLATIKSQLDSWRKRATAADKRRMDVSKRLRETESELATARETPDALTAERATLDTELAAATARLTTSGEALANAEGTLRRCVETANTAARSLSTAREALARSEALTEGAATRAKEAEADLLDDTGLTPEAAAERFIDLRETDPQTVEARLLRARADRERLGAVNLRAKLEIEEAETERTALGSEKAELEAAIAKLRTGLAALNREGRERLLAAFAQVNAHFRDLFTHLFGGGQAELHLTESDDPLEAGLEILCQPPGKRVQTLSLLSGGEQTLAAMALIFAVFLVNPAPVCVLDEVDAPLDDANVERFCALLDEMTRRSDARFLVITHHALTMSRMDRLYGVTMVERGVSKLVSVDLSAAVELIDT